MPRKVTLTRDAVEDLHDLNAYVAEHDSAAAAERVLARIEHAVAALGDHSERGVHVPELASLGVRIYRQIFFKPYRVIYRVFAKEVLVLLISDGRRDLRTLLERRMLGTPKVGH
jgi:toxin ParE1/3/4